MTPSQDLAVAEPYQDEPPTRGLFITQPASCADGLHARVAHEIFAAVAALKGESAAEELRRSGLELLHTVIGAADIGDLRDRVLAALRPALLAMSVKVGRSVLGWQDEFYVDDYLILRINLPYEVARKAPGSAENPGIGRISPSVRAVAAARRVKDPLYNPASYHGANPPAAWAHGPHIDSWTGHSRDGLNIWWAISDVPAEAGMVLYPQTGGHLLSCDRTTLYLEKGVALPPPTYIPLKPGEMLIFDPEILHGTHLNVSDRTRVAVSMRLNAGKPRFDPDCFYAREFWWRASDIDAERWDEVLHLKREDNLAPPASAGRLASPLPRTPPALALSVPASDASVTFKATRLPENGRISLDVGKYRLLVTRRNGAIHAVDRRCPHYGLDLADGGMAEDKIFCPGCALAFDVVSGCSVASSLSLKIYRVREADGLIHIALWDPAEAAA